jgi:DNA-binding transcriptional LysR family regulator
LAALRAGIGIGVCQLGIAARYTMLKQVLDGKLKLSLDMWLAMHRDIGSNRRVRVVFDYLAKALSEYAGHSAFAPPSHARHRPTSVG